MKMLLYLEVENGILTKNNKQTKCPDVLIAISKKKKTKNSNKIFFFEIHNVTLCVEFEYDSVSHGVSGFLIIMKV